MWVLRSLFSRSGSRGRKQFSFWPAAWSPVIHAMRLFMFPRIIRVLAQINVLQKQLGVIALLSLLGMQALVRIVQIIQFAAANYVEICLQLKFERLF